MDSFSIRLGQGRKTTETAEKHFFIRYYFWKKLKLRIVITKTLDQNNETIKCKVKISQRAN